MEELKFELAWAKLLPPSSLNLGENCAGYPFICDELRKPDFYSSGDELLVRRLCMSTSMHSVTIWLSLSRILPPSARS